MTEIEVTKHYRSWIVACGVAIPDFADLTQLDPDRGLITLTFRIYRYPGLETLSAALEFRPADVTSKTILKCGSGQSGRLVTSDDRQCKGIITAQTCETATAFLQVNPDDPNTTPVSVVEKIDGKGQIVISENGFYTLSQDLVGQPVKVLLPVLYLNSIATDRPIALAEWHSVCLWADNSLRYLGCPVCSVIPTDRPANGDCIIRLKTDFTKARIEEIAKR